MSCIHYHNLEQWQIKLKPVKKHQTKDKFKPQQVYYLGTGIKLAYSGAKVQSRFYTGGLVTYMQDQEIRSESGRLPDFLGELAYLRRLSSKLALPRYTSFVSSSVHNTALGGLEH